MSQRQYTIYQEIADPIQVFVAPEELTVDKWHLPRPNPVLRKSLSGAILAGAFFFFNPVSIVANDKVPDWHPQTNQPQRLYTKPLRPMGGSVKPELPCMVDIVGYNAATGSNSVSPALNNLPANSLLVLTTTHDAGSAGLFDCVVSSSPVLAWTKRVENGGANNHNVEIWTAVFAAGGNITVTADWPNIGTNVQAAVLYALTNAESAAAGATGSANSQTLPSVNITGTKPDTLFFAVSADWNAQDGSSRAYRENATESLYYRPSGAITSYFYFKRGTTDQTLHTLGLTSPGSQQAATAILEVRSNCPINTEWIQQTERPYFPKLRAYQNTGAQPEFIETPEVVTLDKWFRPASEPYFSKKRFVNTGEFRFEQPREILLSDWWQQNSIPYFSKRRDYHTGESRFEVPRTVLLSDWFQPAQEPYFEKRRDYHTGESRFEVPREILLSDWFQAAREPVRRIIQRLQSQFTKGEIIAEDTQLNEWWQPASEPYFSKLRNYFTGELRFETPREILLSDWFQEVKQPYFSKRRLLPSGEYRFEVPREVLISDWFQPISQPFKKEIITPGSIVRPEREIVVIADTFLDWYRQASEPYFKHRRFYFTGEFKFEAPRLIFDWLQAISQPYFSEERNPNFLSYRIEPFRQIFFDWWRQASEPVRRKVTRQTAGAVPIDFILVTVDRWFKEIIQPYFPKSRESVFSGQFRVDPLPRPPLITHWFQQLPIQKPFIYQVGGETRIDIIVPEVITLDKWFMSVVQPHVRRITPVGAHELKIEIKVSGEFIQAIFM